MNVLHHAGIAGVCMLLIAGCATESSRAIAPQEVASAARPYSGPKLSLVLGKFENRSTYMRGIFSDGVDRMGDQTRTLVLSHLQNSGRFSVMERENMAEAKQEASFSGQTQTIKGAAFVVTGAVTEFGRKETGDEQLFGIAGSGRKQIAYSKVTLNVVDVATSEIVFSASGAGEYALSSREVLGFGGSAGYDSTLNGKVLDLAIREAVDKLAVGVENGSWRTHR